MINSPLFILAAPRSFTSVVGTMLGQHPQMYGLPETHLFGYETMAERWDSCSQSTYPMGHGLLRTVAQLYFEEQTELTIKQAQGWLRRRLHFGTGFLLESLAEKVHPLILVDKSPSIVYSRESLQRIYSMFPKAKFIHLTRHPRGHGESVMKFLDERKRHGPIPPTHWLLHLATYPHRDGGATRRPRHAQVLDPQRGWYVLNKNICDFFASVPSEQQYRVQGENLLTNPGEVLRQIASWMELRTDDEAIEEMMHPERSPYACFGPPNARYGNDSFFLESPVLRPARAKAQSLEGPLNWRDGGHVFLPKVKQLARQFGYA